VEHLHENGRGGLPKSDEEAARLYKLAAEQGTAMAQTTMLLLPFPQTFPRQ
jgi:TPR repeat protein